MKIDRIDHILKQFNKPAINLLGNQIKADVNCVLIVCAGFEDRAKEILNRIKPKDRMQVVVIDYLPIISENNPDYYYDKCVSNNWNIIKMTYDRRNPAGFGDILISKIGLDNKEIIIDISGMSRFLIVQLIVILYHAKRHFENIKMLYVEAFKYPPSKYEAEEAIIKKKENPDSAALLVSSGVLELCIVPELSSIAMHGQPIRLIAFPSFNTDQLDVLSAVVQPAKVTMINGIPPNKELVWRMEAIREINNLRLKADCDEIKTSTLDYRETIDSIMSIYQEYGDLEKIILSPTGSKMQAVACGISRAFLSDLQIVYPAPGQFASPNSYTSGVGSIWELNLTSFTELL
jgi:hypothetical protein